MSDYEWLVELAAKGLAERDKHPMPRSVTTPEAFYEVMARAALDAIGLPALLGEAARAERELDITDEAPKQVANGWSDAAAMHPDEPPVSPQYGPPVPPRYGASVGPRYELKAHPAPPKGREDGHAAPDSASRGEQGTRKVENARLRR